MNTDELAFTNRIHALAIPTEDKVILNSVYHHIQGDRLNAGWEELSTLTPMPELRTMTLLRTTLERYITELESR